MVPKFELNKIHYDDFGRPTAILAVNKPKGMKSHDVVDSLRKIFSIRQVGHAGTLDPFASGLLIMLLGKATKFSEDFLKLEKEYVAEVLFGIGTDTGDIDGTITNYQSSADNKSIDAQQLKSVLRSFSPSYNQYAPVFSSVKVHGEKLRVLARKYDSFQIENVIEGRVVKFFDKGKVLRKEIPLPQKLVHIYEIELVDLSIRRLETGSGKQETRNGKHETKPTNTENRELRTDNFETKTYNLKPITFSNDKRQTTKISNNHKSQITNHPYPIARICVRCSKGTYIRQLAVDIGEKLKIPSMLVELERTKVGDISLDQAKTLDEITSER